MTLVVYGIPNCDTVKKARVWLAEHGHDYRFHDFKKDGLTAGRLEGWLAQVPLDTLLNRRGTTWRALDEAQKAAADAPAGAIALMVEKPSLIKRPVLEVDGRVRAVGFAAADYAARLA
jgi:arsenate reductase (glutaredoxin)